MRMGYKTVLTQTVKIMMSYAFLSCTSQYCFLYPLSSTDLKLSVEVIEIPRISPFKYIFSLPSFFGLFLEE